MNSHIRPDQGCLYLVLHPDARPSLLILSAELALQGRVYVLDGGNSFNTQLVARIIRRSTPHVNTILSRIRVARAFTCFQMAALIRQACQAHQQHPAPTLVLDLLSTFQDENINKLERGRVLRDCVANLQQLKQHWGVVVSARPGNPDLDNILIGSADQVFDHIALPEKEELHGTNSNFHHPGL